MSTEKRFWTVAEAAEAWSTPEKPCSRTLVIKYIRQGRIPGVEKPAPENAPSNLGVVGRYILTPRIFDHIRELKPGAGGEIQLTDAIQSMLDQEQVLAYRYKGVRYDCGSKLGYLKATVEFALRHPEVRDEFSAYLSQRCTSPSSVPA